MPEGFKSKVFSYEIYLVSNKVTYEHVANRKAQKPKTLNTKPQNAYIRRSHISSKVNVLIVEKREHLERAQGRVPKSQRPESGRD